MSDEKWVTLTPEQVEALDQGVIVRAHRGDMSAQGPLMGLVGEYAPDVWVGEARVKSPERVEVRERDVPELDDDEDDVPKTDPQRLVSVRAEDLIIALAAVESCVQADGDVADRIRAALRGETS